MQIQDDTLSLLLFLYVPSLFLLSLSASFYFTQTVLHETHLLSFHLFFPLFIILTICEYYITFLTLKGLPEWLCPALGASAVLWGRHQLPECLREHCTSHFCPVQQGKFGNKSIGWTIIAIMITAGFQREQPVCLSDVNLSLSLWSIRKAVSVFFCTGEQIRRQRTSTARRLFRWNV